MRDSTQLDERTCFLAAIEGLQHTRDALRGLAILREDMRWLVAVQLVDQLADRVKAVMKQPHSRMLVLPQRTRPQ